MSAPTAPPIIIIKRKGGHGGAHHGGAWKVAYADFVTAMMALFIVLWLLNSSQDVQKAVAGYFRDPRGSAKKMGSAFGGTGESVTVDRKNLSQLKTKLEQAMKETPKFDKIKNNVQMTVTGEGLRIELLEDERGMFFQNGQPRPTENATNLLMELAKQLGQMPNTVLIEGHTDANPFGDSADYTNWELSADRANAARKVMQQSGLRPNQVVQIRGYADQQLRLPDKPNDPSNRRISIIVRYTEGSESPPDKQSTADAKEADAKGGNSAGTAQQGPQQSVQISGKATDKPKEPAYQRSAKAADELPSAKSGPH
jgi:chemotaxis protein MotB